VQVARVTTVWCDLFVAQPNQRIVTQPSEVYIMYVGGGLLTLIIIILLLVWIF
jgi:hypothetical protein